MLFNSTDYLFFFPTVVLLYYWLPHKYRSFMLLVASCIFYIYFIPIYLFVLFIAIIIDYSAARFIEKFVGKRKKIVLWISILSTCLLLFFFKYFNFVNTNLRVLLQLIHWNYPIGALNIILPIGLSFHTFQSLSYVIEVYRGKQKAEHNFGIYSLYVMFFPQLVAGPIERPQNMLHQFHEEHKFNYQQVSDGLKLILWGLFKKIVIADRLATAVNYVYGSYSEQTGYALLIATIFFSFQIYCDFSGYSDIAIGSAQVLGFKLMTNFNRPYFSKSITEFWTRWHISLSSWFRDYVYIPLGGNRVTKLRRYFNLLITFLLSGLWHGANWTYILWGGINGMYLITEDLTSKTRKRFTVFLQIGVTFICACFAWVFFRSSSVAQALNIFERVISDGILIMHQLASLRLSVVWHYLIHPTVGYTTQQLFIVILMITVLLIVERIQGDGSFQQIFFGKPVVIRWMIYYALALGIIFFSMLGKNQFIYFQF